MLHFILYVYIHVYVIYTIPRGSLVEFLAAPGRRIEDWRRWGSELAGVQELNARAFSDPGDGCGPRILSQSSSGIAYYPYLRKIMFPILYVQAGKNKEGAVYPSIYPSVCLSICRSVGLSACLSVYLSIYPSVYLSLYLSSMHMHSCACVYVEIRCVPT